MKEETKRKKNQREKRNIEDKQLQKDIIAIKIIEDVADRYCQKKYQMVVQVPVGLLQLD